MRPVRLSQTGAGNSGAVPLDLYISPFSVSLLVHVTGVVNYTVQFTQDDVFASTGPFTWMPHPDLTALTADGTGTFISPVTAARLVVNSGAGTAALTVLQAGLQ